MAFWSACLEHYVMITYFISIDNFFQDRHSELSKICLNILFNRTQLDNRKHVWVQTKAAVVIYLIYTEISEIYRTGLP